VQLQDYASSYQSKADEELRLLALDLEDLIPEARLALEGELSRRKIAVAEPSAAKLVARDNSDSQAGGASLRRPAGAGKFVAEAVDIYQNHFWFFFKLTLPAVFLAWLIGLVTNFQVHALLRQVLQGRSEGHYGIYVFAGEVLSLTRYLISWIVFSLLFGALCIATQTIDSGVSPTVPDSLNAVRSRLGSLLRISLLLFGIAAVVTCITSLAEGGVIWAYRLHVHSPVPRLIVYGLVCATLLILSRFGLAIPAAMLDNCRPWQSVFRSDELTEGKWLILVALLTKSVIGGYIAGMIPFWLAGLMKLQLPSPWILSALSIAAVAAVEPILFIGFTLLYLKTAGSSSRGWVGDSATQLKQPA